MEKKTGKKTAGVNDAKEAKRKDEILMNALRNAKPFKIVNKNNSKELIDGIICLLNCGNRNK